MKTWQELLGQTWEDTGEEYGPNGQKVLSAFDVFAEMELLTAVGSPLTDPSVAAVSSWREALTILDDPTGKYDLHGHLVAAAAKLLPVHTTAPERQWWERAVADAGEYCNIFPYLPESLDEDTRERLYGYLYDYTSLLLAEIIGGDAVGLTYFREQLPWYLAGRFPCGWEGNWPAGRPRVY